MITRDTLRSLAEELIPHILGEATRTMESMQAGGPRVSDNQRHEQLVTEIVSKIEEVIGAHYAT